MADDKATIVSAPGKVLLTGAYLVLERPNPGLILSTSARFWAIIGPLHDAASQSTTITIEVRSPQLARVSTYALDPKSLIMEPVPGDSGGRNPFVETAVQYAVAAAQLRAPGGGPTAGTGSTITILGDNDFYSQRKQLADAGLPLSSSSLSSLPAFSAASVNTPSGASDSNEDSAPEIAKTGLGSSAAMVTAVVAALLQHFGVVHLPRAGDGHSPSSAHLSTIHWLSQAAHCVAQGKVGSGFDVSSAVFGSQRYVRFSPSVLETSGEPSPRRVVREAFAAPWDEERCPFALPPRLLLVIGEPGAGGSSTPSMIGAVQRWRNEKPAVAQPLWEQLARANSQVEEGLRRLREGADEDGELYTRTMDDCGSRPSHEWEALEGVFETGPPLKPSPLAALVATRAAFQSVRRLLRRIGEEANVPIEPPSQTALLDATESLPGVLFAGVPGAGGYDAVFAVVIGNAARHTVDTEWSKRGVLALCAGEDARGVALEERDPRNRDS